MHQHIFHICFHFSQFFFFLFFMFFWLFPSFLPCCSFLFFNKIHSNTDLFLPPLLITFPSYISLFSSSYFVLSFFLQISFSPHKRRLQNTQVFNVLSPSCPSFFLKSFPRSPKNVKIHSVWHQKKLSLHIFPLDFLEFFGVCKLELFLLSVWYRPVNLSLSTICMRKSSPRSLIRSPPVIFRMLSISSDSLRGPVRCMSPDVAAGTSVHEDSKCEWQISCPCPLMHLSVTLAACLSDAVGWSLHRTIHSEMKAVTGTDTVTATSTIRINK